MIDLTKIAPYFHTWQLFVLAILFGFGYLLIKTGLAKDWFEYFKLIKNNKKDQEIRTVKKEMIKNSLRNILAFANQALEKAPHCIGANYYLVHDSGKALDDAADWYITVLQSTNYDISVDFEKPAKINTGFRWLNKEAKEKKYLYIPDISREPNIKGYDYEYMKSQGIKSCVLCLVKDDVTRWQMVSLNFDRINPHEENIDLRKIVFDFRRGVVTNI